jgi:hypothetical protein
MGCGQSVGRQIHVDHTSTCRILVEDSEIRAGEIKVVIMQVNGEAFDFAVKAKSTVKEVKADLSELTGLERWQQRLTFESKDSGDATEMEDDLTIFSYGVVSRSTILLTHNGNPTDRDALDGQTVLLQGMRMPHQNGRLAEVVRYDRDENQYEVRLVKQGIVAIPISSPWLALRTGKMMVVPSMVTLEGVAEAQDEELASSYQALLEKRQCSLQFSLCGKAVTASAEESIGIDFSTGYCRVAAWRDGGTELIPDKTGETAMPLYIGFSGNQKLFGAAAKRQAHINPSNTVFGFLRLVGAKFSDPWVQHCLKAQCWPYKVEAGSRGAVVIAVTYRGIVRRYEADELCCMVLREMKVNARKFLGKEIKNVVMSVPARFGYCQRRGRRC